MARFPKIAIDGGAELSACAGRRDDVFPLAETAARVARWWIFGAAVVFLLDLARQTHEGWTNGSGRPLGDDFINYWSGAFLAMHGRVGEVYDWMAFHRFQESMIGGSLDFYHYSYPPLLLLLSAPFALMPYGPALAAWLISSFYAFYRALRLALPQRALLLALATPALFVNAIAGQNGAFTAALFGGGLCLLDCRPLLAGALFGLLAYKPQMGVLLPIALVAGGHWRALAAATMMVAVLVVLSVAAFGIDIWSDYARNVGLLRQTILEDGTGVWHRMVSVFVAARRLGANVTLAYAIQLGAALIAAGVIAVAWFRGMPKPMRNGLLMLGTCLATPYLQDYDLVIGAFVAAWLMSATVGPPGRATIVAAALLLIGPLASVAFARLSGVAFGPLFILPGFVIAASGLMQPRSQDAPTAGERLHA